MTNTSQSSLNLIIGPMFSGKTTELLRIAKRLKSINLKVLLINYAEDTRYSTTEMTTHDKESMPCIFVNKLKEVFINEKYENYEEFIFERYDVFCINEAQFFSDLVEFCKELLKNNKTIYVCGLDGDYKQEKFGELIDLVPMCDTITKLHAFCSICKNGNKAHFTKRIIDSKEQKLIGTKEYIPVCRKHL